VQLKGQLDQSVTMSSLTSFSAKFIECKVCGLGIESTSTKLKEHWEEHFIVREPKNITGKTCTDFDCKPISGCVKLNTRNTKNIFKCLQCDHSTGEQTMMVQHIRFTHEKVKAAKVADIKLKDQKCLDCDYLSTRQWRLYKHIKEVHSKIMCLQCEYTTRSDANLAGHVEFACDVIKDKNCPQCTFATAYPGDLIKHRRLVHARTCKNVKCGECDYETFGAADLARHIKAVHHRIKDHQCSVCFACMRRSGFPKDLATHLKSVHDKIKDKKCLQSVIMQEPLKPRTKMSAVDF
jgi:hypothetical protein